jgi:trigger factor
VDEKYKTLDDLKNSIKQRLEKNMDRRLRELKINKLLEKIMENTPVTLPESMVRVELDGRLRNLAQRFGTDANKLMQMLSQSGDGLDDIEGKWRPSAERALHSRLILETLMEEQHIEANDDDIESEMKTIADESDMPLEEAQSRFGDEKSLEYIRENIRERKIFDLLLSKNTVTYGSKVNYLDLIGNNG